MSLVFSILTKDAFGSDAFTSSLRDGLFRNSYHRLLLQPKVHLQRAKMFSTSKTTQDTRGDSQASSIALVYRGSGGDTANEPALGNMEKLLRLSAPNAVLGQIMYVYSCLLSLNVVSDVSYVASQYLKSRFNAEETRPLGPHLVQAAGPFLLKPFPVPPPVLGPPLWLDLDPRLPTRSRP